MADNSLTCIVPSVAAYLQAKLKLHSSYIIMDKSLKTATQRAVWSVKQMRYESAVRRE